MTSDRNSNELIQIFYGFGLLMLCHVIAVFLLFVFTFALDMLSRLLRSTGLNNIAGFIILLGLTCFLFWQLLYAIPLALRFKRRRQFGLMKGVIIGAVITALINGACYLTLLALTAGYG
ncbi:MAG: hypothetical protein AAF579_22970 [Cyanobacteria bacterium P01_C01_bin.118]